MRNKNINLKNRVMALLLVMAMILSMPSMSVTAMTDENPVPGPKVVTDANSPTDYTGEVKDKEVLVEGPTVIKDSNSPTGYTVRFVYKNEEATSVKFVADILLRNWVDLSDEKVYQPSEYRPGLMRGGGAYEAEMEKLDGGYWVIDVPLAAGANQYWFYVDGNRDYWVPDPANSPIFAPDGLTGNSRRAFNAVYVPYDPEKQDELAGAREIENPRTDGQKGTWSYVEIPTQIGDRTRYLGVYLPYGYDEDREEPYKTIYMQHGSQQDASDWMNIGSVPNIMDNLLAEGLTEPAIVVTTDSTYLGSSGQGYPNLTNIIIPFIEDTYNVSTNAADRSFAGLSMGGGITISLINYDATQFGYFGIFSGGAGINPDASNLGETNILIGIGPWDNLTFLKPTPAQLAALDNTDANYKYIEVAGAHDFNTWCQLFTIFARDYLWKPEAFKDDVAPVAGPKLVADTNSPTGYTGEFVYYAPDAEKVYFCGDLMLSNHLDPTDTKIYTPFEYKPGLMRRGGSQFKEEMTAIGDGYWYYEVPLAAGANQYWFNVDNGSRMLPDPENHPKWSPNSNWDTKNAYNALYVPYDEKQGYSILADRVVENPRTDGKTGTWSYVPIQIADATHYLGVYLPYEYDADREEPYKTIYMQHGGGQDESDWMGIGSVQNIMDNLAADGLTEPAVIVTTGSQYIGNAQNGFSNLFNIVLPFIEDNYNVSDKAEDRAFAGLSMGSMITQSIINYDASTFGYFGPWSGGMSVRPDAPNLGDTYIFFGSGLYEGGVDTTNLEGSDAKYKVTRVAGAHDFNTWCQLFTIFVRDYLWKPEMFSTSPLILSTSAHNVNVGDYFNVNASFGKVQNSNVVVLNYTFDGTKFEYANYTPADGVTVIGTNYGQGYAKITVMIPGYNAENLGDIMLRAKEDAKLNRESQSVRVMANYVLKDESGNKTTNKAAAYTSFTTIGDGTGEPALPGDTNNDRIVDLIDLSNMIDWFGIRNNNPDWSSLYTFFDFNNNNEIDISDICNVANLIE